MPKVSVIIPVYNVEQYLATCINSIVNQSIKEIEIILVNDGSTDNSLSIIKDFEKKDSRIVIIDQKNTGLGGARNSGIKAAKSDYLVFIDSDDYISKTMIESLYKVAIKQNAEIVKCRYARVKDDNKSIINISKYFDYKNKEEFFKNILSIRQLSIICDGLYKKELFIKNNLFFKKIVYEDTEILFKLFFYATKAYYINKPMYYWRKTENSISGSISNNQIDDIFKVFNNTYKFLKNKQILKPYKNEFIERCFFYHNRFINKIKEYNDSKNEMELLKYLNKKISESTHFNKKNLHKLSLQNKELYIKYLEKKSYMDSFLITNDKKSIYKILIQNHRYSLQLNNLLEDISLKEDKNIKKIKNKFKGESCIIVGKGPSYDKFDKNLLKNKFTIIFSDTFLKIQEDFTPSFYIEDDSFIIEQHLKHFKKPIAKYIFLPNRYYNNTAKKYHFNQDFSYHKVLHKNYQRPSFSKNINKKIYSGASSMHLCLQLAYYLGFKKVYLLGIDLNYQKEDLSINRDTSQEYIQKIIKDFQKSKKIFEKDNRKILNLSKESILDMFEYRNKID